MAGNKAEWIVLAKKEFSASVMYKQAAEHRVQSEQIEHSRKRGLCSWVLFEIDPFLSCIIKLTTATFVRTAIYFS